MREFLGGIRAEILKMRHTFLYPLHICIPVLGAAVFLLYCRLTGRSGIGPLSAYAEVIGVALPFMISIVCAGNICLEEENHFQVFPGGYTCRWKSFLAKITVLAGLGFLAIGAAVLLFGTGSGMIAGEYVFSQMQYLKLAAVLFLGSVPLYLEHLFLNLKFSKTVSECVGVAQFLLSALFLTGLGDGKWQFFPCTWSARGAMLTLSGLSQKGSLVYTEGIMETTGICLLLLVLICAIIGIWFYYYEGRQCND